MGGCFEALFAAAMGRRYKEMMVMPFENCSTYFRLEVRP